MIPILYKPGETDFSRNGIGSLTDAISCVVTEERNGMYELTLVYPLSGPMYAYIAEDCIIKAKPNETSAEQLFRIYKSSKPIGGKVTFYAEHISYILGGVPIDTVSVDRVNAQAALRKILSSALVGHGFSAESDIQTLNSLSLSNVSVRSALGGTAGSVLDVYGGEYEFDNFKVILHAHRGVDTGVRIAYGKNLTDLRQEKNIAEMYTGLMPYARYSPTAEDGSIGAEEMITLPEKIIYSPNAKSLAHTRILQRDFSDQFGPEEEITVDALRKKAQAWAEISGYDAPKVSITVAFRSLWQSPEYADYAFLERVSLCDTVSVVYDSLGISASAKVIKTVYDVLGERYNSIDLGDARADLADRLNQYAADADSLQRALREQSGAVNARLADADAAIKRLAKSLSDASGLYITVEPQPDGSSIYYMHNKPLLGESDIVWKLTSEAIGISTDGGNSYPYGFTVTGEMITRLLYAEGINADYINTGSIVARDDSGKIIFSVDIDTGKVIISGDSVQIGGRSATQAVADAASAAASAAETANTALDEARKSTNLTIVLGNEYEGIPTDHAGAYTPPLSASTTVSVYYGHTDVSASCQYSCVTSAGVTGTWDGALRTYTVTALSTDTGWVDITADYMGLFQVTKRFNVAKIKGGAPGAKGDKGETGTQGINLFGFNKGIFHDSRYYGSGSLDPSIYGVYITDTYADTGHIFRIQNLGYNGISGGYTVSGEFYASKSIDIQISTCNSIPKSYAVTESPQMLVYQGFVTDYNTTDNWNGFLDVQCELDSGTTIYVKNLKVEHGKVDAPVWTPALQDLVGPQGPAGAPGAKGDKGEPGASYSPNLAQRTNQGVTYWSWLMQTGDYEAVEVIEDGIRCCKLTRGSAPHSGYNVILYADIGRKYYQPGKKYTISFEIRSSVSGSLYLRLMSPNASSQLDAYMDVKAATYTANEWTKCVFTATIKDPLPPETDQYVYIEGASTVPGVSHTFRNLMITEGEEAVAWAPSTEDMKGADGAPGAPGIPGKDGANFKLVMTDYRQSQSELEDWATPGHDAGVWVTTSTSGLKAGDSVAVQCFNTTKNGYVYIYGTVTSVDSPTVFRMISAGMTDKGDTGAKGDRGDTGADGSAFKLLLSDYAQPQEVLDMWSAPGIDPGSWDVKSTSGVKVGDSVGIQCYNTTKAGNVICLGTATKINSDTNLNMISAGMIDKGNVGAAGRTYFIELSANVLKRGANNAVTPATLTASAYYRDGSDAARTAYAGRWIVATSTDGTAFTTAATSGDAASYSFAVGGLPANIVAVRFTLCAAGGTATALDMQTVPVIVDVDALSHEQIFNLLTNNGTLQGIYQEGGNLYINGAYIKAGTVSASQLASNAVTADKISAGAVNTDKLAANAVTADNISAGAITAGKLAADAVTAEKISAGAVNADKLAANAVTAAKISAGAVNADKLAANAVTAAKISADAVTADKLAAGAVTTEKLAAGNVTAEKLAAGAVTADKIAAGAITADKIAAGAITADKITIGNFSNLSVVNPDGANPYGAEIVTSGTKRYFRFGSSSTAGYYRFYLRKFGPDTTFSLGDAYCLRATGYATGSPGVSFVLRAQYTDGTTLNMLGDSVTFPSSEGSISMALRVFAVPSKPVSSYMLFFETSNRTGLCYLRDITVYRMATPELIVNGSVTAEKISVTDLSALGAKIGGWTIGSTQLCNGTITSGGDGNFGMSTADFTRTVAGQSLSSLRLAIGSSFGVAKDGTVFCGSLCAQGYITGGSWSSGNVVTQLNNVGICMSKEGVGAGGGIYKAWILTVNSSGNLVAVPGIYSYGQWDTFEGLAKTLGTWSMPSSGMGSGTHHGGGGYGGKYKPTLVPIAT